MRSIAPSSTSVNGPLLHCVNSLLFVPVKASRCQVSIGNRAPSGRSCMKALRDIAGFNGRGQLRRSHSWTPQGRLLALGFVQRNVAALQTLLADSIAVGQAELKSPATASDLKLVAFSLSLPNRQTPTWRTDHAKISTANNLPRLVLRIRLYGQATPVGKVHSETSIFIDPCGLNDFVERGECRA
jgi:hypothetical protein